jgi:hypothetical protein
MISHNSVTRSSIILRWAVGLSALSCISGSIALMIANGAMHVRQEAERVTMQGNMYFVAHGMRNYASANGGLPPAAVLGRDGKPILSWRVLLLPYIGSAELYNRFKLDEPWDSAHNRDLIALMPLDYQPPFTERHAPRDKTFFQVIRGPGTPFDRPGLRIEDLKGDARNTFLIVEAAEPVIWTKPDDIDYNPDGPLPLFGGFMRDGYFRVVMVEKGSTQKISLSDEDAIRTGITGTAP